MITLLLVVVGISSAAIISRNTWGARSATYPIPALSSISDIVIGNSGYSDCSGSNCYDTMRRLQARDQNSDLYDTNFNFYVSGSGVILEGRGWFKQGGFTTKFANTSLGIGYLGSYDRGITTAAENVIKQLLVDGFSSSTIPLKRQYCLLFTCDKAIKDEASTDDAACPGGNTYSSISNFYVTYQSSNLSPMFPYRPCGCGRLHAPQNGKVNYDNYDTNSVATYSCDTKYVLIGDTERKCGVSGSWSDVQELPMCLDPKKSLVIVAKKTWDVVESRKEYIDGFPISTFFISAVDNSCNSDKNCRTQLKSIKRKALNDDNDYDVPCNFYISQFGVVYEGRGWGLKGTYKIVRETSTMQGICFLGYDAVNKVALDALFYLVKEAVETLKIPFNHCFKSDCPKFNSEFCAEFSRRLTLRSDQLYRTNEYCPPPDVKPDLRATAKTCRLRSSLTKEWVNYQGEKAVSKSGCRCQDWSSQHPVKHPFYPQVYKHAKLTKNYCRNPDVDENGPWCLTDPQCSGAEVQTCEIPQCTASILFASDTRARYTVAQSRTTITDKLSLNFKPNSGNTRILRIEGGRDTYWEVSLVKGYVRVEVVLMHGGNLTTVRINSSNPLAMGEQSSIHILRKNHKFLTMINNKEHRYTHLVNLTSAPLVEFVTPRVFYMGRDNLPSNVNPFTGCMAEASFNQHDIISILAGAQQPQGTLDKYPFVMADDGCAAVLPFEWGSIDIVTTVTPKPNVTDAKPTSKDEVTAEPVIDGSDKSTLFIIIGVVILVLIIVCLLIGCVFVKRYNRDKGVYKVDEAKTTKWDWKKGIIPVKTRSNGKADMDYTGVNKDDNPEVFA